MALIPASSLCEAWWALHITSVEKINTSEHMYGECIFFSHSRLFHFLSHFPPCFSNQDGRARIFSTEFNHHNSICIDVHMGRINTENAIAFGFWHINTFKTSHENMWMLLNSSKTETKSVPICTLGFDRCSYLSCPLCSTEKCLMYSCFQMLGSALAFFSFFTS